MAHGNGQGQGRTRVVRGGGRGQDRTRAVRGGGHGQDRTRVAHDSGRGQDRTRAARSSGRGQDRTRAAWGSTNILLAGKQGNKLLREEGKGGKEVRDGSLKGYPSPVRRHSTFPCPRGVTGHSLARVASLHIPSSRIPVGAKGQGLAGSAVTIIHLELLLEQGADILDRIQVRAVGRMGLEWNSVAFKER